MRDVECPLALDRVKNLRGASVHFADVQKKYGGLAALAPTSLTINAGEFFAIIGPSGSGKSTLLGITAGFISPSGGSIRIEDRDIVTIPAYERNIGMVFQNYALFPHMTVAQNIAFPLKMRRVPKSDINVKVKRLLDMVRLEGIEERRPAQLSGGQQQRVALARAAAFDPLLLLMDEPLGALDKNLREEMQSEIKRFQASIGATVLYVTHDQQEAASMADRIAVMRGGIIEQIATPRVLYELPKSSFVASFLGEATLIPLKETLARHGDTVVVRTMAGAVLHIAAGGSSANASAACVRPENIVLGTDAAALLNRFRGVVVEGIFTAGSVRYRISVAECAVDFVVRVPSHYGVTVLPVGASVLVGWRPGDAVLVA
jgi:putative spermidine/putrescine transport system ATP-binding protein